MKRFAATVLALSLIITALFCVNVKADTGDLVRFLPTEIEVQSSKVIVRGYFVNMNQDVSVQNFRNFRMKVYHDGELLVDGDFGDIHEFTIKPLGMKYQSFSFSGSHDLKIGTIDCGDRYYAAFSCKFTTVG